MKHLSRRWGAKLIAWLLLAVTVTVLLCSAVGTGIWYGYGGNYDGGSYLREELLSGACFRTANYAYNSYYNAVRYNTGRVQYWQSYFSPQNSNFAFTLTDDKGNVLLQNYEASQSQYDFETSFTTPTTIQRTIHETFPTYETAANHLNDLNATEHLGSLSIDESGWRYYVTCRLEAKPQVEAPTEESAPVVEEPTPIEPLEIVHAEGDYYTYYFGSEEDRNRWIEAQEQVYDVYSWEYGTDVVEYTLRAEVYRTETVYLTASVPLHPDMQAKDDIYYRITLVQGLLDSQQALIPLVVGSAVLSLLLVIFLFCGAGRRAGDDEVHLSWLERIPFEFLGFAGILACCIPFMIQAEVNIYNNLWAVPVMLAIAVPAILLCIWFLCSAAVRVKAHRFWRSTIVGWVAWICCKGIAKVCRWLAFIIRGLPLVWQIAVGWLTLSFVELLMIMALRDEFVWVLERLLLTPVLLILGIHLTRLRQGAHRIAEGDLSTEIDLRYMVGDIRRHGQDLNSITDGLHSAVDERMRSERLKTELITNVSHDIKTPLTSIVNYVDLLSQEEMPSETAKEYLEVLKRQSERLRKLTVDLVEASKAATGNVEARPEVMDVNVLLAQTTGEFEEKLHSLQLEPMLSLGETPLMIYADGRLLWRVFDNLMNNICKYALPGTRVYLSAQKVEGQVEITFRNISRYALNVSSDELIERFVRGDESRHTEGSGLGLSIAKSLTDLQGGTFELTVDGDLFKAIIRFDAI